MITRDEIKEVTKTIPTKAAPTNFNKKVSCKIENFYIFMTILLITIAIYCYLIKHQPQQKILLPYYSTSNKLKEIDIKNII